MDKNDFEHSAPANPVGSTMSIGGLFNIIKRHLLLSLAFGSLLGFGFALFLYQQDPIYTASSSLLFELSPDRVMSMEDVKENRIDNNTLETAMNTNLQRITSKDFADNILSSYSNLEAARIIRPFQSKDPVTGFLKQPGDVLREDIMDIEWVPQSQVFHIAASHPDPKVAQELSNAYASQYISYMLDERSSSTQSAVQFLKVQADELRNEIRASEEELQAYRAKHNIVADDKDRDIVTARLSRLSEEVTEIRMEMISLESTLKQIKAAEGDRDKLLAIREISLFSPIPELTTDLERVRNEKSVLSETFLSKHPKMLDVAAKEEAVLSAIDSNINKAVANVERSLENYQRRSAELQSALSGTEVQAKDLDKLTIEYNVLKRRLDTRKKTLDSLSERLSEMQIANQLRNTNVEVLSIGQEPLIPSDPNFIKVALSSFLLFAFGFLATPLLIEYFDGRLRTFAEIEYFIGKPVLGHMRRMRGLRKRPLAKQRENLEVVENFRSLYAQMSMHSDLHPPYAFMVTSTNSGEGKSFVAAHLAMTASRHGLHTLIIDADLRRPSQHNVFDVEKKRGLIPWFKRDTDDISEESLGIVQASGNLHVLCTGGVSSNPTEVLQSKKFRALVEQLKKKYDLIIFDTPPFGPCSDAIFLSDYCDYILYTIRQNYIPRRKAKAAIRRLDRTKSPVLGVVLNQISGNSADGSYAAYESEYGVNYGYSNKYYSTDFENNESAEESEEKPKANV